MADSEAGSIQNVKLQLDIETENENPKIEQYLQDGRSFLDEQQQRAGLDPVTNPTTREIQLIENFAIGKYVMLNTQSHSEKPYNAAREDIKTHVRAAIQSQTDDGVATGENQFKTTTGNVRDGNGL